MWGYVEPFFWPSPVRIGLWLDFNEFHLAICGWTSSAVDEEGDCRLEVRTTANRLGTSLADKEEPAIIKRGLFAFSQNLT